MMERPIRSNRKFRLHDLKEKQISAGLALGESPGASLLTRYILSNIIIVQEFLPVCRIIQFGLMWIIPEREDFRS